MYDEFEKRDTVVIAVAQEDTDLKTHGRMASKIKPRPRFEIVADIKRKQTAQYRRTTAYIIDKGGVVRQILPMMIHHRATWRVLLNEIDKLGELP